MARLGDIRITAPSIDPMEARVEVMGHNGEWVNVPGVISVRMTLKAGEPIAAHVICYPFGGIDIVGQYRATLIPFPDDEPDTQ